MPRSLKALLLLLALASPGFAQSTIKIRDLPLDGAPADTDELPVAKAGNTTKKTTRLALRTGITEYPWLLGKLGGQTLCGDTASAGALNLSSTCHATKGKIFFGTASVYDQANDRIGIGTTSPSVPLDVRGAAIFNEAGAAVDFRVEGDTNINLIFAQGSTDRVGIGTATPANRLDVNGDATFRSDLFFTKGSSPLLGTSDANPLRIGTAGNEVIRLDTSNNLGLGTALAGTSATRTLIIGSGVAPSSSPADVVQLYSSDSAAGNAQLFVRNEAGNAVQLTGIRTIVTSSFAKASDTTLANITGLTFPVLAGQRYGFRGVLYVDSSAAGGHKFAVAGTATATTLIWHLRQYCDATKAILFTSRTQSMGSSVGESASGCLASFAEIDGAILVNAAGTLTLQFAQNNASGTSSVLALSHFLLYPM